MLENTVFTRTDEQRFIITADTSSQYYIRAAVYEGKPMVSIGDVARYCGLKETSKVAERCDCQRVKLQSRGRGARRVSMWYFGLKDAAEFIRVRLVPDDDFYDWFINRLVPELAVKDLSFANAKLVAAEATPPVQPPPKAPTVQGRRDDMESFIARIDQMIVELVTLKQELSCMG